MVGYSQVKSISRVFACAALAVLLATLISIAPTNTSFAPQSAEAASQPTITVVRAATGKVVLKKGTSYKLGAKASEGTLSYRSSKPKVAKVSAKGVVKALKPGKSTITVKAKSGSATASKKIKVTVVKAAKYKKVTKVTVTPAKAAMKAGETITLKAAFTPKKASNKNLTFTSSNASVAEVSASGVVTAKAAGNAKITVKSCDNAKAKASVTVSVAEAAESASDDETTVSNTLDGFSWGELKAIANEIASCSDEASALAVAQERGIVGADGKLTGAEAKEVTLSDGTVCNAQLIGLWHDTKTEGGKAGLTFAFKEIVGSAKAHDTASVRVGWASCSVRAYLNGDFLDLLPQELSSQIAPIDKTTNIVGTTLASGGDGVLEITSDTVWLMSLTELYGQFANAIGRVPDQSETYDLEGTQYKYYADNSMSNIQYTLGKKYAVGATAAKAWWLRSPLTGNANYYFYARTDGTFAYDNSASEKGLAPCFCL